jgi:chromosome segregation ATPase
MSAVPVFTFSAAPCEQLPVSTKLVVPCQGTAIQRLKATVVHLKQELILKCSEVTKLSKSLQSVHAELDKIKGMYDDCQDDLLEYEGLKEAFDTTQLDLQKANIRVMETTAQAAATKEKLQRMHTVLMTSSESQARLLVAWANRANQFKEKNKKLEEELALARKQATVCCSCKDKIIDTALAQCGHCLCSDCFRQCKQCPVCRSTALAHIKVFV